MLQGNERGFTLIELMIVVWIIGIVAAMGAPGLLRARMAGNEASAIGSVRAINSGQVAYSTSCGAGYFADTLPGLAAPPPGGGQGFVSPDLTAAGGVKSGYVVSVAAAVGASSPGALLACNGAGLQSGYYVWAQPQSFGQTGRRAFASNTAGIIYQDSAGVPPSEPFTVGGTVSALQ